MGEAELPAAGYVHLDGDADWWLPSGTAVYPDDPAAQFYRTIGTVDPLGLRTVATYDEHDLLVTSVLHTTSRTAASW